MTKKATSAPKPRAPLTVKKPKEEENAELMAMVYGPRWRTHMPEWAKTYAPKAPEAPEPSVLPDEPEDAPEPPLRRRKGKKRR